MIDSSYCKKRAAELCRTSRPNLIIVGGLYYALMTIVNALSTRVLGSNVTESLAEKYFKAYADGDFERCLSIAAKCVPSNTACAIDAALQIVFGIVGVGLIIFVLNTVRNAKASYGNLLDGFAMAGRAVLLSILRDAIIFLGSMLLIVPGVIALYRYRMAKYVMIDHPECSVWQCLHESGLMMKGHKMELFRLDLSLLGWILIGAIIPLAAVWTVPYTYTVWALYYEDLKTYWDTEVFGI